MSEDEGGYFSSAIDRYVRQETQYWLGLDEKIESDVEPKDRNNIKLPMAKIEGSFTKEGRLTGPFDEYMREGNQFEPDIERVVRAKEENEERDKRVSKMLRKAGQVPSDLYDLAVTI